MKARDRIFLFQVNYVIMVDTERRKQKIEELFDY